MMQIGVCVHLDAIEGMGEKLAAIRQNGFTTCQLLAWNPEVWTEENAAVLKSLLQEYGVTPSAFWCGWIGPKVWNFTEGPKTLGLVPEEYRAERVKNLCDGADFAHILGITDVITHMGFIPEDPNDPVFVPFCDAVRTVAEHMQKNGQWLLFETGQETPVAMLRCFETVGTDNLGVNLDTANLILYGKANPVDALDVIGKYVRNLHAKDGFYPTNGMNLGHEARLGDGKVDFEGLFAGLHKLGYNGHVTIEREISGEQQNLDILYAREYMQEIIDRVCVD
ncbi:MAG: sugar phosphate isomerase/epimerase [Ruminococcaceae bacterium]|nr:sugar phosphate isomerase/epimerase [Oscillospiraceae bacterium]